MNCEFCSSPVHVWFQCPKKPDGWKPARLAKESAGTSEPRVAKTATSVGQVPPTVSTAAMKESPNRKVRGQSALNAAEAGTQALPVDTSPVQDAKAMKANTVRTVAAEPEQDVQILRPGPKFNKNAYMAVYMREVYRPRMKAKKEAAK